MFRRASDISQLHKSVRSFLRRASIALGPKNGMLGRNAHSLYMRPPVTPEYTAHTVTRRWPVLFLNPLGSRQSPSQTRLAGHLPIPAISEPWPHSAQTRALRKMP